MAKYIIAGKREGFDWEDEGRIVFTRDPQIEIAGLTKDGYVEFHVMEQTKKVTADSTEVYKTESEEKLQKSLDDTLNEIRRLLHNTSDVFRIYESLRDLNK